MTEADARAGAVPAERTRPVVVGFDGLDPHDPALARASAEAGRTGAPLVVVHAYSASEDDPVGTEVRRRRAKEVCRAALRSSLRGEPGPGGARPQVIVRPGRPEEVLHDVAAGAAILVLGVAGPARSPRDAPGLTTQQCLRHAPCPVMLVPRVRTASCPTRRVVLAVDPSGPSPAAAAWAEREASQLGCELTRVAASYDATRTEGSERGDVLLLHGGAVRGLAGFLRDDDLLVLGDRGRAGMHPAGLHSVSGAMVARAACPVVLVPSGTKVPRPSA